MNDCCCPGYVPNSADYTQNPLFIIIVVEGDISTGSFQKIEEAANDIKLNFYSYKSCKAELTFFPSHPSSPAVRKAKSNSQFHIFPYVNGGKKVSSDTSSETWMQFIYEASRMYEDKKWTVFRSPFYSWNNNMYDALHNVRAEKLLDTDRDFLPLTIDFSYKTKRPQWPFLLDQLTVLCSNDSSILNGATPICPGRYKGQWILPNNALFTKAGSDCYTLAECSNRIREENSSETFLEFLFRNIDFRNQTKSHQQFNGFWQSLQPMTLVISEDYFLSDENAGEDLKKFFSNVSTRPNAFFAEPVKVIEWMINEQHKVKDLTRLLYGRIMLERDCNTAEGIPEMIVIFSLLAVASLICLLSLIVGTCLRVLSNSPCFKKSDEREPIINNKESCSKLKSLTKHLLVIEPHESLHSIYMFFAIFIPAVALTQSGDNASDQTAGPAAVTLTQTEYNASDQTSDTAAVALTQSGDNGSDQTAGPEEVAPTQTGDNTSAQTADIAEVPQTITSAQNADTKTISTKRVHCWLGWAFFVQLGLIAPFVVVAIQIFVDYGSHKERNSAIKEHDNEKVYAAFLSATLLSIFAQFVINGCLYYKKIAPGFKEIKKIIAGEEKEVVKTIRKNLLFGILNFVFLIVIFVGLLLSTGIIAFKSALRLGWVFGKYNEPSARFHYGLVLFTLITASVYYYFFLLIHVFSSTLKFYENKPETLKELHKCYKKYVIPGSSAIFIAHMITNIAYCLTFTLYVIYDANYLDFERKIQVITLYLLIYVESTVLFIVFMNSHNFYKISKTEEREGLEDPKKGMKMAFFIEQVPFFLLQTLILVVLITVPSLAKLAVVLH